jgi:SAM-dependent methyltransferase/uncharacterized protein YbaR (Trm112 family)
MPSSLADIIRCPATGQELAKDGVVLRTVDGKHAYPIADGVPVLVDADLSVFSPDEVLRREYVADKVSKSRQLVRRLLPGRSISLGTEDRYEKFAAITRAASGGRRALVLVVGGGRLGDGMATIADDPSIEFVETDVYLGPRVTVVCDGHHLPFAGESFDGVIIQAVLEHVLDPIRVVAEIHRVLRPDGAVYAETPFMQQVHEGAFDFTRWTESGHRRLFRMFSELDRGAVAGPGTALLWSLCYFARSLPPNRSRAVLLLDKLTEMTFFWLTYLDKILISRQAAVDGASGVYFLGRKAVDPLTDREIIGGYRGAVGRPVHHGE